MGEFDHLDILVNNAGIVDQADGPPSKTMLEAVEHTLRTNFLGALRVTQAMLPLLRRSSAARIVNVSSGLGSLECNGDPIGSSQTSNTSAIAPQRPLSTC